MTQTATQSAPEPTATEPTPAEPTRLWFMGSLLTVHLAQADSQAGVSLMEHRYVEGFAVPLHVHHEEDETFYILEGRVRFQVGPLAGGRTVELGAGRSLHVPGGTVHAFRVVSPEARFLTVTPGRFEGMVRAAAVPAETPTLPPQVPMTEAQMNELALLCNRNGIEFVGPPID